MFETIKRLYGLGLYTNDQVAKFVEKSKIKPEQYEDIVGEPYGDPV